MKHVLTVMSCGTLLGCGDDAGVAASDGSTGRESRTSGAPMTGADGSSSSLPGNTTKGSSTTGPMPCMVNEDCADAGAPFCDPMSGECVDCGGLEDGNAACAEIDADAPLCMEGDCVACTVEDTSVCDAQALICDEETSACVQCSDHDQCGDAACNLFDGTCLPADAVVRVGPEQEFATLTEAVMSIPAGGKGTIIVYPGMPNYDEAIMVDGGRVLAFLATEVGSMVAPPRWILGAGGSPQLSVGDATVLVDGLQLSGNADDLGVLVDGGRAWLDRSRVVTNLGGGIRAQNAGEIMLRNCFVGGDVSDVNAVEIDSASARITYSTLGAGTVSTVGLMCTTPVSVETRNSIIVSRGVDATGGYDVVCDDAMITHSATEIMVSGEGNNALGEMPTMMPEDWFVGYAAGDFHLTMPPIVVATTAEWRDGDPLVDIDGDARPGADMVADVAGADVP